MLECFLIDENKRPIRLLKMEKNILNFIPFLKEIVEETFFSKKSKSLKNVILTLKLSGIKSECSIKYLLLEMLKIKLK